MILRFWTPFSPLFTYFILCFCTYSQHYCSVFSKLFLRNTLTDLDILGIIDKLTRSAARKQRVNIENNIVQKFCMYNTFIIWGKSICWVGTSTILKYKTIIRKPEPERGTERRNKRTQKRFGARAQTLILSFLKGKVKIPFLKSLILAQDERWRRA